MQTDSLRRSQRGGTLIGLAFGLVVGVLISFGVVWYLNKTPLPFVEKVMRSDAKESENGAAPAAPVTLPGKPGDKPIERKFEFYDILEGKKEASPTPAAPATTSPATASSASTPSATPAATAPPAATASPPPATSPLAAHGGGLYLQAGAFQKSADAENLKARLAMLGFEASVLEADVPDKGVVHRVRIGPYANAEELNRVRIQLSQNSIPATVVRVKE